MSSLLRPFLTNLLTIIFSFIVINVSPIRSALVPLPLVSYQQAILMRPKGSQNPRASTNVVLVSEKSMYGYYQRERGM